MREAHRNELTARLRSRIDAARARLGERLSEGAGGPAACAELSDAYDELVRELWSRAVREVAGPDEPPLALVATGGWGRRHQCPYSDIDFVLLAHKRELPLARAVADALLYPLWDAGLAVGHAVRDPAAAARLAGDDLATATALLDVRHIAGDESVSRELIRATRRVIAPGGNANGFVKKLADERVRRHDRFGASLYLLEPNLKQGIGGLRDLATAVWAARARWGVGDVRELVTLGQLSSRQAAVLADALDFLLVIRSLLHLAAGRATDQLTFEIQEAIAPKLVPQVTPPEGDVRPAVAPAVEALMRRYYLHARGVVQVADRLLEAAMVPARRRPRIARIDPSFLVFNGKLATTDPAVFRDHPAEMLRAFRVALDHRLPIYGHTKELMAEHSAREGDLTGDREAAEHFVALLVDPRDARQPSLLEEMHQVGLVSAVIPEFAPCTCRVQHDLYHVYTVDQHQLYAVALLKRLARGELADEAPLATRAASARRSPALYLATLLHDVGKPLGKGHADKGARLTRAIALRLGMSAAEASRAEFLVRQHLTMSHLSQRRDLSDPDVIRRFADKVGGEEALEDLYLLTYCDTAMTAPGNLSAWKDQLLGDLLARTRGYFRGGAGQEPPGGADQARRARARVRELLQPPAAAAQEPDRAEEAEALTALAGGIDDRFYTALTPRQVARHVRLARRRQRSGQVVELSVKHYPLKGHSELALVADDKPGLLATIAGVLTAHRVDVLGAVVSTRDPDDAGAAPLAMDLFFVRTPQGAAIPVDDPRWQRIGEDLGALLVAAGDDHEAAGALIERRRSPSILEQRVTPGVQTEVRVINDASAAFTVVEVFTQDRPGVLHAITRTLAELELDIHLSKVSTEGEKVADVFYVTKRVGWEKVVEAERVREIETAVAAALARLEASG